MKAFQHKLSDPLPELHDQHIFEEREARRDEWDEMHERANKAAHDEQWERTYDGEDAEEWMRHSDIDQQGENL